MAEPLAGWYPDPQNPSAPKRYWNGESWPTDLDAETRAEALADRVADWVSLGWRVEAQTPANAVLVMGRRPNHLLHFIIGLFTLGLWWIFVWLPLAIFGGEKRKAVSVDATGHVIES